MTPKIEWGYVGNAGPNKETLTGRLLTMEMVTFTFERCRRGEGGVAIEHASFPFLILGVDHQHSSKDPKDILREVFRVKGHEGWLVRGLVRVGGTNSDPKSWVYVELQYTSVTRHAQFMVGLEDLLLREEFTSQFQRRKNR
jgi:hypothetical protein